MPIINWNVAAANKFAFLRLIFFSSVRSFPAIIRYALDQTPLSLRNSLARAWLGTTFEQLPQLLYSEPPAHGLEKIDRESFNTYLVPKCDVSSLKHADGVVMFFHGGGMILGHPLQYLDAYERWAATAAKSGRRLVFVAVQYPLSTSAKWPAQRNSAIAAYRWVLAQGVETSSVAFAGDSAGANLAALSMLHLRDDPLQLRQPACAVLMSPWLDMSGAETIGSPNHGSDFMLHYDAGVPIMNGALRPEGSDMYTPEISAALWEDVGSLPPQLVMYSSTETLASDSEHWIVRSIAAGVSITEYQRKGEMHTFPVGWPVCSTSVQDDCDATICNYILQHIRTT